MLRVYVTVQGWWSDLRARASEESGASAVEYGLLVFLIAGIIIAVVTVLGKKVSNAFDSVQANFPP